MSQGEYLILERSNQRAQVALTDESGIKGTGDTRNRKGFGELVDFQSLFYC